MWTQVVSIGQLDMGDMVFWKDRFQGVVKEKRKGRHMCSIRVAWKDGGDDWLNDSDVELLQKVQELNGAKVKKYPELPQEGRIFFEQGIKSGMKEGTLGVQVASDGRVWVCVDDKALIRFTPAKKVKKDGHAK